MEHGIMTYETTNVSKIIISQDTILQKLISRHLKEHTLYHRLESCGIVCGYITSDAKAGDMILGLTGVRNTWKHRLCFVLRHYEDDLFEIIGQAFLGYDNFVNSTWSLRGTLYFDEMDLLAFAAQDLSSDLDEYDKLYVRRLTRRICSSCFSSYARITFAPKEVEERQEEKRNIVGM